MRHGLSLCITLGLALVSTTLARQVAPPSSTAGSTPGSTPAQAEMLNLGLRGVYFVENQGQWSDASVMYGFKTRGLDIAFHDSSFTMHLARGTTEASPKRERGTRASQDAGLLSDDLHSLLLRDESPTRDSEHCVTPWDELTLTVSFPGGNDVQPEAANLQSAKFNYFIGDDESKWASNVPSFGEIVYPNLYDGVDLHIKGDAGADSPTGNVLKYEFHVAPGADYSQIQIHYEGIDSLCIDSAGNLQIATTLGTLTDAAPIVWQGTNKTDTVAAHFELVDDTTYRITLDGFIDPTRELIIDPDVLWSRYLGGESVDDAYGVAVASDGSVVAVGLTASQTFEGQNNSNHGDWDAYVVRTDADGQLMWMTFVGGSRYETGYGVALTGDDHILLTGETNSSDLPQRTNDLHGATDVYIARLDGDGSLLQTRYIGGSAGDETYAQPAITSDGDILVAGDTESPDLEGRLNGLHSGFPSDAFICRLDPSLSVRWSLYLGGTGGDAISEMALDTLDDALATGVTWSADFDGRINSFHGNSDPFVVKVGPDGQLLWMTYLGGSGNGDEDGNGIAVESDGTIVVCGTTESDDLERATNSRLGYQDIYIARLKPNGTIIHNTYIGGSGGDYAYFLTLDARGNALITGETNSYDFVGRLNGIESGFAILVSMNRLNAVNWMIYCGGSQGWGNAVAAGSDAAYVVGGARVGNLEGRLNEYSGEDDGYLLKYGPLTTPQLSVDSSCPNGGPIHIAWSNATPSAPAALLYARNTGSFVIPNNRPCPGTTLGLGAQQLQIVFTGQSDSNGSRAINANAGPAACGAYLQLLDLTTCTTSNVARIE